MSDEQTTTTVNQEEPTPSPDSVPAPARPTTPIVIDEKVEIKEVTAESQESPPKLVRSIASPDEVKLLNPNEIILDRIYQLLTDRLRNKPLTNANIIEIIGISIQLVEKAKQRNAPLSNADKKSIVTNLIIKLVQSTPMDNQLKSYFTDIFIPLMLSSTIDNLCSLNVNDIKRGLFSCCK